VGVLVIIAVLQAQVDPANFETAGRKSTTLGGIKWVREKGGPVRIVSTEGRPLEIELKSQGKVSKKNYAVEAFLGKWVSPDKGRFCASLFTLADSRDSVTFKFKQYTDKAYWKINDVTWVLPKMPAFDFDSNGNNGGDWVLPGGAKDTNTAAFTDNPGSWGVQAGFSEPRFENYVYKPGDAYEFTLHLKTLVYMCEAKKETPVALVEWKITCTATVGSKADVTADAKVKSGADEIAQAEKQLAEAVKNGRIGEAGYKKQ
jgi:hypothetical protein